MSGEVTIEDLENSLPSWISDHLGDRSYMETTVREYPNSPREDHIEAIQGLPIDTKPPPEKETNIMTQDKLDHLGKSCYFPAGVQAPPSGWQDFIWPVAMMKPQSIQEQFWGLRLLWSRARLRRRSLSRLSPTEDVGEDGARRDGHSILPRATVLGFSLVDRAREMRDGMMAKDLKSTVAELEADKERSDVALLFLEKEMAGLKKYKEDFDVATEKLEKKVAEMKRRENLTKKLAIDEFKTFKEYKETKLPR
ncbi:hypothetical protein Acr_05g0009510 [Actinidia rufa]|uniref:Uncharacterized protein n=1 Tax=Actinidia rufa TaxID=165716 RepID=A0A7J0ELW9_9ERIC|nr:hypothetical protein Acr_05g0009510 [Actinidia rufa]